MIPHPDKIQLSLMTFNVGGLKRAPSSVEKVIEVIQIANPDILAIQEITEILDLDGNWTRLAERISGELGYAHSFFGPTISLRRHFDARKALFVDGIFRGWQDWISGNAIFSRWPLLRLDHSGKPGLPQNLPIFQPVQYQGNRESDPRYMLLAHLDCGPVQPYVISTHFTTVMGEHSRDAQRAALNTPRGILVRQEQSQRVLDIIQRNLLERGELVFLLGDLNAEPCEPCIADTLEQTGGFVRLQPANSARTHPRVSQPVDHILAHAGRSRVEYTCRVIDENRASDHHPVIADIVIYPENSPICQALGPGVIRMEDSQ